MMNLSVDSIQGMDNNYNSSCKDERWTEGYLVDRLKQNLALVEVYITLTDEDKVYHNRKYNNQAHHFLKVGAFKPVPPFLVSVSDLAPKILKELNDLDTVDRKLVLKQAVARIFEDINCNLYHDSISRVLEVILVD